MILRFIEAFEKRLNVIIYGRYWWALFLLLILIFTGFRLFRITADPNPDLSISAAPFTDEGLKAYSSRNYVNYGDWHWTALDGYKGWYENSTVPTFIYNKVFETFGASFTTLRAINVAFSVLTMVLLFFLVKQYYTISTAFVSLTLFGVSHFLIMFNRLGFYENMLIFFTLLIFYAFCEISQRRRKMHKSISDKKILFGKELVYVVVAAAFGCFATVGGIFTKQSITMVVASMLPFLVLYFFYANHRLNPFLIKMFYITVFTIAIGYAVLGNFGWFDKYFKEILQVRIFDISIGYLLPLKKSSSNFDPIYLSFVKSLYLEYIYLQPFIFFTGILFAIHTYNNFLYKGKLHILDTALASWFLFGFLFLALMRYHPARYYMLIAIPTIILSARFFTTKEDVSSVFESFKNEKRFSLRSAIVILFWFYVKYYTALLLVITFVPFSVRKRLYSFAFTSILHGEYSALIPPVAAVLGFITLVFVGMSFVRKKITTLGSSHIGYLLLLSLIICFQLVQYGKWVATVDNSLYDLSRKFAERKNDDSILAGCWSATLVMENNLRSLIMQEKASYNVQLTKMIERGEELAVRKLKNGKVEEVESGQPLYLLVSNNGPFDMKIRSIFKDSMTDANYIETYPMGWFDVELYRLDKAPSKEEVRYFQRQ